MADSEPDNGTTAHWQQPNQPGRPQQQPPPQAHGEGSQGQESRPDQEAEYVPYPSELRYDPPQGGGRRWGSGGRKLPWFIAVAVVAAGAAAAAALIPGGSPSSYKLVAPPTLDGIPTNSAMTRNWDGLQVDFSCIANAMQTSGVGSVTSDVIKGYARTLGTTDTIPGILYYGLNGTFSSSVSHFLSTTKDCNFAGFSSSPAMQSVSPGPHGGQLQVGSGNRSITCMWSTATDVAVVAYQDPGSGTNPASFCRQVRDSVEVPAGQTPAHGG